MKRAKRFLGRMAMVVGTGLLMAGPALATGDTLTVTTPSLNYTVLSAVSTLVLAGAAAMWAVRKSIKTVNKS